jgi:hypothetical protein
MVRYSFLVGLFHPRLHAGLSRRLHSLTVVAQNQKPSRDRQGAVAQSLVTFCLILGPGAFLSQVL